MSSDFFDDAMGLELERGEWGGDDLVISGDVLLDTERGDSSSAYSDLVFFFFFLIYLFLLFCCCCLKIKLTSGHSLHTHLHITHTHTHTTHSNGKKRKMMKKLWEMFGIIITLIKRIFFFV